MKRHFRSSPLYKALLWLALSGGLLFLGLLSDDVFMSPALLQTDDFVQYWAAGRLNLLHGNPYDPEQLLPLQQQAGRTEYVSGTATIAWNPPWILALLMPFGGLRYPLGRLLWWFLNLALIFTAATALWRFYGGPVQRRLVAWVLVFVWVPTLFALRVGQIGPVLLAALIGFLFAAQRHQWGLAGACLAVLTIKPQLVYLFLLAVAVWLITQKKLALFIGGSVAVGLGAGIALVANPGVIGQYIVAVTSYPPAAWATPTLGGVLRFLLGSEKFWLQFIPSLLGCLGLVYYIQKRHQCWDWDRETPVLLVLSLVTAPYLWTYDLVLLILPLLQATTLLLNTRRTRDVILALVAVVALNGLIILAQRWTSNDFWLFWIAPAFGLWYGGVMSRISALRKEALPIS